MIWLKSEPEFTKRSLRSYVRYLEDLEISEIYGSREESFELSAALLRTHLGKIRSENAQLLAEVLKLNFRAALKPLAVNMDYDSRMFIESDRDFQKIYNYIKEHDPDWDPDAELATLIQIEGHFMAIIDPDPVNR